MDEKLQGYAVPRLPKLSYLEVVLREIDRRASFERIRQALLEYVRVTGEEQSSGGVVSRLRDEFTFWSPTQEALSELMRLGFVEQAQLPSSRRYVDAHRANTYKLTTEGKTAVEELAEGPGLAKANFLDMLAVALSSAHPGFADLLVTAQHYPLCIPEYTIDKLDGLGSEGEMAYKVAEDAIVRMTEHWPSSDEAPSHRDMLEWLKRSLNRRFPQDSGRRPSKADILDTVDDAVLGFVAHTRKIRLDAISFNVCMSWAAYLHIMEESRYVENWPGRTVWATAVVEEQEIRRNGFRDAERTVVEGLRDGFKSVAENMSEGRASGYLPIYRVRAQAAFSARVNLGLADIILQRILSGQIDAPYRVQVALGRGMSPPRSEPVFTHEGRRFFDIMITDIGGSS